MASKEMLEKTSFHASALLSPFEFKLGFLYFQMLKRLPPIILLGTQKN